ncbi:MAG: GNAT family N-acetyltransferase [Chloroflexota bacterium]
MLHGDNVVLRALRREDLRRQWEFNNDLEFELQGGGDAPEPQSYERLLAAFDESLSKGRRDGPDFAIEVDDTYIGSCGLFNIDPVARTCELGIGIGDPAYRGRGYGRDALRELLRYAFRIRNIRRVWLSVNGNNERAIRAYAAVGFVEEGRLRSHVWSNGQYLDLLRMGILDHEWVALNERAGSMSKLTFESNGK